MSKAAVIEASTARSNFAQLSSQARHTPVKVTRHGQVEFVIISPELFGTVEALQSVPAGELERMQDRFASMFQNMQSDRAAAAYDAIAALPAEDLAGSVAKAYKRAVKPVAGRRKLRVVR